MHAWKADESDNICLGLIPKGTHGWQISVATSSNRTVCSVLAAMAARALPSFCFTAISILKGDWWQLDYCRAYRPPVGM